MVLSHLSAALMRYLKEKAPNRQNFPNILCTTFCARKGMYLDLVFLGSHSFFQTMPKACFQFSFSNRLLVGSMPVWRDAIYTAELVAVFYLVYICTSYWVRFLASVTQHSSAGSCDFHSSESGVCFIFNVYWLSSLLELLPLNLCCCVIHLNFCRAWMNSNGGN